MYEAITAQKGSSRRFHKGARNFVHSPAKKTTEKTTPMSCNMNPANCGMAVKKNAQVKELPSQPSLTIGIVQTVNGPHSTATRPAARIKRGLKMRRTSRSRTKAIGGAN